MFKNTIAKVSTILITTGLLFTGAAAANAEWDASNHLCHYNSENQLECASSHYTVADPYFTDVPSDHIFYQEIEWMAQSGFSKGWTNTTGKAEYRPDAPVKRDAVIVFLYRMAGSPSYTHPKVSPFKDVPTTHTFYKEIAWAYENGIANGWGSGANREFRPSENVLRDAVAVFLYRYTGQNSTSTDTPFNDVPSNHVFAKEIAWMYDSGLANGWGAGDNKVYQPLSPTKRDAMAAFLYRAAGEGVIHTR